MSLMIREIGPEDPLDAHLALEALPRVFPRSTLEAVIVHCGVGERRQRKMSNYRVKTPAHQHWPQPTKPFHDAIVLLI